MIYELGQEKRVALIGTQGFIGKYYTIFPLVERIADVCVQRIGKGEYISQCLLELRLNFFKKKKQ